MKQTSCTASEKKLARFLNFMSCYIYIDNALSVNYSKFGDYVDRIHSIEYEINKTTDTAKFAWPTPRYWQDRLRTKLYHKLDSDFPIVKLPFLNVAINIPAASAHAYISQYWMGQSLRFLS